MNTITRISVAMAFASGGLSAIASDVIHTNAPAAETVIRVENGTHAMYGDTAYRTNLKHYWNFDSETGYLGDAVGSLSLLKSGSGSTVTRETGDGAKFGRGAISTDLGVKADGNPIVGQSFTVAFWFKPNEATQWDNQGTLFYVGQQAVSGQDLPRLSLGFGNANGTMFLWKAGNNKQSFEHMSVVGAWDHYVITRDAENKVRVYINGIRAAILEVSDVFAETDNFCFGYGWHTSGGTKPVGGGTFDEIMVYDKVLSQTEIEALMNFEFSAIWSLLPNGLLRLNESLAQDVFGCGDVSAKDDLVVASATNSFMSGVISGGNLVVRNPEGVMTTLAGTNTYTGTTTIESGTLSVNPAFRDVPTFENELVAYYPLDNAADPGADWSGNGNHLQTADANIPVPVETFDAVAGGHLRCAGMDEAVKGKQYLQSNGTLNGFAADADNSFVIGGWAKLNGYTGREGLFWLDNGTSYRTNLRFQNAVTSFYFGDNNYLGSITLPFDWTKDGWHHVAIVYDASAGDAARFQLFIDGQYVANNKKLSESKHGSGAFYLGIGGADKGDAGYGYFNGSLDEWFVLKGANTNDVARMYNHRRASRQSVEPTRVLPAKTSVSVAAGAKLLVTNANETIEKLLGTGTVEIGAGSELHVRKLRQFAGIKIGEGRLVDEAPGLVLVVR